MLVPIFLVPALKNNLYRHILINTCNMFKIILYLSVFSFLCKDEYSEEEYADSLQHINENIEEIKQHLLDDNMVVKKGTDRLTVKIFPN